MTYKKQMEINIEPNLAALWQVLTVHINVYCGLFNLATLLHAWGALHLILFTECFALITYPIINTYAKVLQKTVQNDSILVLCCLVVLQNK